MPFCKNCENLVKTTDKFCAKCGEELFFETTNKITEDNKTKEEQTPKHKVDWRKQEYKGKESFWVILKTSIRHTFYDNENKISNNRKVLNLFLGLVIIGLIAWMLAPKLDLVQINLDNESVQEQGCMNYINSKNIELIDAQFYPDSNKFSALIENNYGKEITLKRIAKTYEFSLDSRGETTEEEVEFIIPNQKSLNLTFFVNKEPYIIGLYFDNCENLKILKWKFTTE